MYGFVLLYTYSFVLYLSNLILCLDRHMMYIYLYLWYMWVELGVVWSVIIVLCVCCCGCGYGWIFLLYRNIKYTDDTIIRSCCDGPIISKNNIISFLLFIFFASLWP